VDAVVLQIAKEPITMTPGEVISVEPDLWLRVGVGSATSARPAQSYLAQRPRLKGVSEP
jgi:hypothetical protein